jgi:glutamine synthetase
VEVDPGRLPEAERIKRGLAPLPTNLGDAIAHLSRNQMLLNALGAELAQAYLAVRKAEWEALKDMDLEKEVQLLLGRY